MTAAPDTTAASDATMAALVDELGAARGWRLWLVESIPTDAWPDLSDGMPEAFATALLAHLHWLRRLEADGTLVLSGPVDQEVALGPGLSVLRAGSRAEAASMLADEPMALAGYRTHALRSWTVNEGSLTVRVDLVANQIVL